MYSKTHEMTQKNENEHFPLWKFSRGFFFSVHNSRIKFRAFFTSLRELKLTGIRGRADGIWGHDYFRPVLRWGHDFFGQFSDRVMTFFGRFSDRSWLFLVDFTTGSWLFSFAFATVSWLFWPKLTCFSFFLVQTSYRVMTFFNHLSDGVMTFSISFRTGMTFLTADSLPSCRYRSPCRVRSARPRIPVIFYAD